MKLLAKIALSFLLLQTTLVYAVDDLKSEQVKAYIDSAPEFRQWSQQHQAQLSESQKKAATELKEEATEEQLIQRTLEISGLEKEMNAMVQAKGFKDAAEYGRITGKILRAFMALRMAEESAFEKMSQGIAQLEQAEMPPEQKQQMLAMMKSRMAQLKEMSTSSKADQDVVRPFLPQLKQAVSDISGAQ